MDESIKNKRRIVLIMWKLKLPYIKKKKGKYIITTMDWTLKIEANSEGYEKMLKDSVPDYIFW